MQTLLQDLRYGARMLVKRPGFALIAVITLALGVGANTAIFSVVNAVLLRPLPYREPGRLVRVYSEFPTMDLRKFWVSPPEFLEIQKESQSWESIGAWATGGANISSNETPIRVNAARVTRSLIETLGVQPLMGRNFTPEEDQRGGPNSVLISHSLWQSTFGGQPDIIGKQIRVNAQPFNVIGVMPAGYAFPPGSNEPADVWAPLQIDTGNPGSRGSHFLHLIGRLKPGVSVEQARDEMSRLQAGWKSENRSQHLLNPTNHPVLMVGLHEDVVGGARPAVLVLLGVVALVLLIACANVASLLLARSETRQREFAVRLALGAQRGRMIRQFLTEGLILVLLGAGAGVLLAYLGLKTILATAPDSVPRTGEIGIDLSVLAFTAGVSILSVLIFGLAPIVQLSENNLAKGLHGSGQRTGVGGKSQMLRKSLVVIEIALAVLVVVGSGLMIRAFWKLRQVELGFQPNGVISFSVQLPRTTYRNPEQLRFATTLEERLRSIPGVVAAAMAGELPPLRPIDANDTMIEGYQPTPDGPAQNVDFWNVVGEEYFSTMRIRTMEGRTFELSDRGEKALPVVVVNQTLARRFWQGSPIGKRVNPGGSNQPIWLTIVGVVEDTKNLGVDKPAGTELYFLKHQTAALGGINNPMSFVARTSGDPLAIAAAIRTTVREIDPSLPIYELKTMSDVVSESLVRPRFLSLLLGIFSAIALLLSAVGIYGVMAYSVSQRTQEIGVRMALGARTSDVLKMVLGQGAKMTALGIGIGLAAAIAFTRLMATLLFQTSATDPATFAGVVAVLILVALLACYFPARRATKVDPMVALRDE